ncbi:MULTISPECIES: hypothetical protein [Cyanophyceae]|uniref:Uncharacterized protein n=1 Tax=Leptolyngbya subtilissima DQ-A4 TaxID=2933933 RepID=A0ABV0KC03_9CYAN|nr:hypothetical protein [Nodosilinea sp. FACHB-141]MBD2111730.1 hypothetical protein [Nodosilinea sp. FACHB-141]
MTTYSTKNTYQTKKRSTRSQNSGAKTARSLLYWLAICVAVVVAAANMLPYCRAVSLALINIFDLQGLVGFFGNRALALISIPVGIVLWAFIQTAETYPILLKHDRKLMRLIALEADSADQLQVNEDDDPALVRLKEWYNHFPMLSIRTANRASLSAYIVDTFICLAVFPPVDGGFGKLVFVVFTGQWGLINWGSVGLIVTMLFCFELMVRFILFLGLQWHYLKRAHG